MVCDLEEISFRLVQLSWCTAITEGQHVPATGTCKRHPDIPLGQLASGTLLHMFN